MNLKQLRDEIDNIDDKLLELLKQRMDLSDSVADYKIKNNLPVYNPEREKEILNRLSEKYPEFQNETKLLFSTIMEVSKARQNNLMVNDTKLKKDILNALSDDFILPSDFKIACQGVEGAYSSIACKKSYPNASISYYQSFDDVFTAVDNESCLFGLLPIENSSAGTVTAVYDLMMKNKFYIYKSITSEINHCLLVNKNSKIEDITDIYSHPQGIDQCSEFLKQNPKIKVHIYSNTAAAAEFVSKSGSDNFAAIASRECSEKYGLKILKSDIQNQAKNFTRFIVISKKMIITEEAKRISLCLSIPHVTGSLCKLMTKFALNQLNLTKLESRPIPEKPFEFMFFFEFDGKIKDEKTLNLICSLEKELDYFAFLGNY